MMFTRHSHCFSKCQLQLIIDDYLSLGPYYKILLEALKLNVHRFEERSDHRTDIPHPIRVYSRDYQISKNILNTQDSTQCRTDIRSTYASGGIRYFYLYPLEYVIQILESSQYYSLLPSNTIINGLLTTTNIQIIIESLKIISDDMCKKIRSTIAGKQLRPPELVQDRIIEEEQEQVQFVSVKDQLSFQAIPQQSKVDIPVECQEGDLNKRNIHKNQSKKKKYIKREIAGTKKYMRIDQQTAQKECRFCQGYLIYLYETIGDNPLDDDINRLSPQSFRCLRLISKVIPHFTLYLNQTNQTHIPVDMQVINKVLNSMGLVITEDIFDSQLNPKNAKPITPTIKNPQNLIEELQPYFYLIQKKKDDPNFYSLEELFRMVIYCPTTDEVKIQLRKNQGQMFQKQALIKNFEVQQKTKNLMRKQCEDMRQFEQQRLIICQNLINTKPVYRQLRFQEEVTTPSTSKKPSNYNALTQSKSLQKSQTTQNNTLNQLLTVSYNEKTDARSFVNQLSISHTKNEEMTNSRVLKKKTRNKEDKKKKRNELAAPEFHSLAMSTVFKKNMLKTPSAKNTNHTPTIYTQNVMTSFSEYDSHMSRNFCSPQVEQQQLPNGQFKKILYNAFMRKNNISRNEANFSATPTSPQYPQYPTFNSTLKSQTKKMNTYNSSISNFIDRKNQEQQLDCIQKQEKELYNKQLLNGQYIKNEVYEELKRGEAQVFGDYQSITSINDTFRLDKKNNRFSSKETQFTSRANTAKGTKKKLNLINVNSTKYNQTGIIRNQKYNKNIKDELINYRQSYLEQNQKQNQSKNRLQRQTAKNRHLQNNKQKMYIKQMYEQELKQALETRKQTQKLKKLFNKQQEWQGQQILL